MSDQETQSLSGKEEDDSSSYQSDYSNPLSDHFSSFEEDDEKESGNDEPGSDVSSVNEGEEVEDEESGFSIFKEDNPYKSVDTDEENGVYQVIGNEIIVLARTEGVCCLCSNIGKILFVDNSYGSNIATQICLSCIKKVLKEDDI